jgi:hypothetical protein
VISLLSLLWHPEVASRCPFRHRISRETGPLFLILSACAEQKKFSQRICAPPAHMAPNRTEYLSLAKAALLAGAAMGLAFLIAVKLPGIPTPVRYAFGFPLFFPGALVFLPFAMAGHNIHDIGKGAFLLGLVANWVLYTLCVRVFMETGRRKRSLRAQ